MKRLFIFLLFLLNAKFAFGYYTENILNQCGGIQNNFWTVFSLNQYTCASGEFLPAYTDGCRLCPSGYTCSGGTYTFNENGFQGAILTSYITQNLTNMCSTNVPHESVAIFTPNVHTCSAGYYMPANYDGCQLCPENSYCPGGTYTFNETTPQGITACAAGTYAPEGMWEVAQCGRIFHVGDDVIYLRSVRKTVHALNFDMDMDGIADYFANMTPLSVPMHINSAHGLKILLDGIEYSVYDDTVDLGLYENNPFVPAQ